MMAAVTTDKEVAFLRERVLERIGQTHRMLKKMLSNEDTSFFKPRGTSSSLPPSVKEAEEEAEKFSATHHKFLTHEELPWEEDSETFKEPPCSSISCLNDFSISNIRSKYKE
jgi:hypothetical protein